MGLGGPLVSDLNSPSKHSHHAPKPHNSPRISSIQAIARPQPHTRIERPEVPAPARHKPRRAKRRRFGGLRTRSDPHAAWLAAPRPFGASAHVPRSCCAHMVASGRMLSLRCRARATRGRARHTESHQHSMSVCAGRPVGYAGVHGVGEGGRVARSHFHRAGACQHSMGIDG